ncbi:MAG TPA: hypothetical protein VGE40_05930 [Bacilli bacterium]
MSRLTLRLLMFVFLTAFLIFFMIDMVNKGMEQINEPVREAISQIPLDSSDLKEEMKQDAAAAKAKVEAAKGDPLETPAVDTKEADTNKPLIKEGVHSRLPDKIGGLLQITADHTIGLVVSIFENVFE